MVLAGTVASPANSTTSPLSTKPSDIKCGFPQVTGVKSQSTSNGRIPKVVVGMDSLEPCQRSRRDDLHARLAALRHVINGISPGD